MRWPVGALAAGGLAVGLLIVAPGAAQADERIRSYSVRLRIEPSGDLLVSERISYDFGPEPRHGILRDLPIRRRFDDRRDRLYPVQVMGVGSPDAPDQYRLEDAESQEGPLLRIRIGDPDQTVTGGHDYRIDYRVQGALDGFTDHDELYWKAVGSQWKVPIGEASATVTAPAAITHVACHAGPAGVGRPCGSSVVDGRSASFAVADLRPHEGLTVGGGLPDRRGAAAAAAPGGALEPGPGVRRDPGLAGHGRSGRRPADRGRSGGGRPGAPGGGRLQRHRSRRGGPCGAWPVGSRPQLAGSVGAAWWASSRPSRAVATQSGGTGRGSRHPARPGRPRVSADRGASRTGEPTSGLARGPAAAARARPARL